jgi:hypothetical protein
MYTVFWLENLKVMRPFGRPRHRWGDNIRMEIREIGWEAVDWIHLARDTDQWRAVVNTVMSFRIQ